jgi:tetratricopeptide (TPR) repeat protein
VQVVSPQTKAAMASREPYERRLQTESNKAGTYHEYAVFELLDMKSPARAKFVYQTALLEPSADITVWIAYINFLSKEMRDIGSARATFEKCRQVLEKDTGRLSDLIALYLENAIFEEENSQIQKSRKIYETLTQEIAPGNLKSMLAFTSFEMRMSNTERAKDLYFKAFEKAINKQDSRAVTLISVKYARFLAFKCNDVQRACEIIDKAINSVKPSKVLYLSQLNLMKHLEGLGQLPSTPKAAGSRVISTYEKALFSSELPVEDKQEIATSYVDYVLENAVSISQIKAVETKLRENGLSPEPIVSKDPSEVVKLGKRQRTE